MNRISSRQRRVVPMRSGASGGLWLRGERVPVNISDSGHDILLVLLADVGTALDRRRPGLVLESVSSRGLVRVRGSAIRIDADLARFDADGDPEIVQRRQFVRVVAPQRVELDDACGRVTKTHALNISGGGMLVSGPSTLDIDAETRFSLFLSESETPVVGLGRVIRAADKHQRAIVFEDIGHRDRERLIRFIFDRQRAALAITRGDAV